MVILTIVIIKGAVTMQRRVSAMALRKSLGQIMNEVALRGDEVVVERDGKPLVAMISIEKLQKLRAEREAAWDRIFKATEAIHERNKDVDPQTLLAEIEEAVEAAGKENSVDRNHA